MSSEHQDDTDTMQSIRAAPDQSYEVQQFGRTGWDFMFSAKWWILISVVMLAASISLAYAFSKGMISAQAISSFLGEYWPVFVSPLVGLLLGRWTIKTLYRPSARYLLLTDLEQGSIRLIQVPEERFRMMRQAGNTFSLHSLGGRQVYLIRDINEYTGYINYGWIHEERAEVVAVNLDAYNRWRDDLTKTKVENLQLVANPQVMAAELSRINLKDHLNRICKALGLADLEEQKNPLDAEEGTAPETEEQEVLNDSS